ncbi:DUF3307 domain-containing protein [Streptomyces liangshanensis]|uniref:DUF3307 domain-containing protein n=1 Tax=Streptomyces liangshanensis TaxID=2717324 RepID=UPI0036DF0E02
MFAALFILLYTAHLLADCPFQTDHQAGHKDKSGAAGWRANLAHSGTHIAVTALLLGVGALTLPEFRINAASTLLALAWIGGTHSFIDRRWPISGWMAIARQSEWAKRGGAAHVDQTAHITALVIAAIAMTTL